MSKSKPHISLIREALERDCWRMRDGKRDFSIRDDALIALRSLEEQYEGVLAEWRDYRATTEDVITDLEEQLEAAEQKLTDIRAIDRGWPATMTDADKLKEVKRIAGRAPNPAKERS